MGLAVVVLVGAVAVGWLTGGTWESLLAVPLRSRWLLAAAVLAQLVGAAEAWLTGTAGAYVGCLAVSALAGFGFCARNRRLAGLPLVALGLLANAYVVARNGAMPVSTAAAARAGVPLASIAAGTDPRHTVAGTVTAQRWLGDVVPVALPLHPEVASPGDVLIAAGIGELVVVAMRGRWRQRAGNRRRAVAWGARPQPQEEPRWPRRPASAAPVPSTRPTTASAPTPDGQARPGHAAQALVTMSRRS